MANTRKWPVCTTKRDKNGKLKPVYKYMSLEQKASIEARHKEYRMNNPERLLLNRARNRAKKYNIPFDLEIDDVHIPVKCPIFGIPLEITFGSKGGSEFSPSLDRINPKLGYVKGNVMVVSNKANAIKSNATANEILKVEEFYQNLEKGNVALCVAQPLDQGLHTY